MARFKLARLLILFLLVAIITMVYLIDKHLSKEKEVHVHALSGKAEQLLKEINERERREQLRKHKVLQGTINPFFRRRPSHKDYPRSNQPVFGREIQQHLSPYGNNRNTENKPLKQQMKALSTSARPSARIAQPTNKNNIFNNRTITEYIKTELLKRERNYQRKQFNRTSVILGKVFNAEKYLSAQRITDTHNTDPMKRFQFNQLASDATPFNRTLWDVRNSLCQKKYEPPALNIEDLPSASVIICFHNEARSALLRTVYSVLNRSPSNLLKEVILVDDYSHDANDGQGLTDIPKVKLIRLNKRQGLIRARLVGAKAALGQVLTFLDSHCEVTIGWLEPLLARINESPHHVVSPVIDIIRKDDMKYNTANSNIKGGFGHALHFKWDNLNPQELLDRRYDNTAPIRTPAIAGGLFAIDKKYFEHIGTYDNKMEIWGGENVEISMRIWMCGGTLEIIPCSRVGHIFRSSMPYSFGPGKSYHTTVTKNLRRTAEVWMDEYKHLFYQANNFAKTIPYGNITSRIQLKKKLQCKPFNWYIENVYPEFVSGTRPEVVKLSGYLRQEGVGCFVSEKAAIYTLVVTNCDKENISKYEKWFITSNGRIKHHSLCLTTSNIVFPVNANLTPCSSDKGQHFEQSFEWIKNDPNIVLRHKSSGLCLASKVESKKYQLVLRKCDAQSKPQQWQLHL